MNTGYAGNHRNDGPMTVAGFERLRVFNFQQFEAVDIDLSNRLTILTGANGAGKTTLLKILGNHFNWYSNFLTSPSSAAREKIRAARIQANKNLTDSKIRALIKQELDELDRQRRQNPHYGPAYSDPEYIGALTYRGGIESLIEPHDSGGSMEFSIALMRQQNVNGLYIGSHRAIAPYRTVDAIPAEFSPPDRLLDAFIDQLRSALGYQTYNSASDYGSIYQMKMTLLAAALYGEGNSSVRPDATAREVWDGFQVVLRLILPSSLGFVRLVSEPPEILVETNRGEFAIDSLSGGLRALFELAWQIHLKAFDSDDFTVCIDEPENHLHPSLQRSLVPNLLRAFPAANFVLATHSPFIVTASEQSSVYVLRYTEDNLVVSELLDFADRSMSAELTLTEVLGVESTSPVWVEQKYQKIMDQFRDSQASPDGLAALLDTLVENGLGNLVPGAIREAVDEAGESNEESSRLP